MGRHVLGVPSPAPFAEYTHGVPGLVCPSPPHLFPARIYEPPASPHPLPSLPSPSLSQSQRPLCQPASQPSGGVASHRIASHRINQFTSTSHNTIMMLHRGGIIIIIIIIISRFPGREGPHHISVLCSICFYHHHHPSYLSPILCVTTTVL